MVCSESVARAFTKKLAEKANVERTLNDKGLTSHFLHALITKKSRLCSFFVTSLAAFPQRKQARYREIASLLWDGRMTSCRKPP